MRGVATTPPEQSLQEGAICLRLRRGGLQAGRRYGHLPNAPKHKRRRLVWFVGCAGGAFFRVGDDRVKPRISMQRCEVKIFSHKQIGIGG